MPRTTFTGVKLVAVGLQNMDFTVTYPDIKTVETFMAMKEACDAVTEPKLVSEAETGSNKPGKGNP